jgi:hypothetical protein
MAALLQGPLRCVLSAPLMHALLRNVLVLGPSIWSLRQPPSAPPLRAVGLLDGVIRYAPMETQSTMVRTAEIIVRHLHQYDAIDGA